MIRVLFVCLGNICRSPLAEGVFAQLVGEAGLADRFEIDSAGTSGYHAGEPADPRTREVARRRGIELTSRSRRVLVDDLTRFDYLIVMDRENRAAVEALAARADATAEIALLRSFEPGATASDVPDPYYGGPGGFDDVHDIVERACRGLLAHIRREHGL